MKRDGRLSAVLHALLHMAERDVPMTSDTLAQCLGTHPVVVRRTMGLLRDAGLVTADRGHAGGWRISADLTKVTLRQLHEALGEPALFAVGNRNEHPQCLVEQAINAALDTAFADAEALLLQRFESFALSVAAQRRSRRVCPEPGIEITFQRAPNRIGWHCAVHTRQNRKAPRRNHPRADTTPEETRRCTANTRCPAASW